MARKRSLVERLGFKRLAERLGFKGLGCIGVNIYNSDPGLRNRAPVDTRMTLGEMLEADEQLLASNDGEIGPGRTPAPSPTRTRFRIRPRTVPVSPSLMPLMRLFEEMFREDELSENEEVGPTWSDSVCCVCMGSKKGSALVPCGHTFCRLCSRKLAFDRGTCALCNRRATSFLDLF